MAVIIMIISEEHKFIFLACPKTGSQTLHAHLEPYGTPQSANTIHSYHLTVAGAKRTPSLMGDLRWNEFTKICFIRNPWDRYVSLVNTLNHYHKDKNLPLYAGLGGLIKSGCYEGYHQYEYLLDRESNYTMDYVGKFENFERDVNNLFEYLKLPIPDSIAHYYDYEKTPQPTMKRKKENTIQNIILNNG